MSSWNKGVNVGGWLSQIPDDADGHAAAFITRDDLARIAQWGFDHVRVPVDHQHLERSDEWAPTTDAFRYLDACVEWCASEGLGLIIDLHSAPDYSHDNVLAERNRRYNTLFDSRVSQGRFLDVWRNIATRYRDTSIPLGFELLNEVVIPQVDAWNRLLVRAVDLVRELAPDATVIVGGTESYGAGGLHQLELPDDQRVMYTFHFYEPLLFTHQGAHWVPEAMAWAESPSYPGDFAGLEDLIERFPEFRDRYSALVGRTADRSLIAECLQPAIAASAATGRELYCGEFGVVEWVDPVSRRRWVTDVIAELTAAGIGHALWNYKGLDFGLVNASGEVTDSRYLEAVLAGT